MTIAVRCPTCERRYTVPADRTGKKARCSACRHVFVVDAVSHRVPQTVITDPIVPQASAGWQESHPEETADVQEQTFAEWRESQVEPSVTSPVASIAARETTVGGLALDRMKLTYALQWWGLWAVAVCVAGVLAFYVSALVALAIIPLVTWISLVATVGGIAHLAVQSVARNRPVHWSAAWALFARRGISLVLGSCLISVTLIGAVGLLFGALFAVSHLPYVGGVLGGLLVVPTFAALLFAAVLTSNLHLLIVIIGVEDCSAWGALQLLISLVRRDWFALLGWTWLSPFLVVIGTTLMVAVLTGAGLSGALTLCGGEQLLLMFADGIALSNVLHALSVAIILAGALAFITVFATLQFTVLYCRFA